MPGKQPEAQSPLFIRLLAPLKSTLCLRVVQVMTSPSCWLLTPKPQGCLWLLFLSCLYQPVSKSHSITFKHIYHPSTCHCLHNYLPGLCNHVLTLGHGSSFPSDLPWRLALTVCCHHRAARVKRSWFRLDHVTPCFKIIQRLSGENPKSFWGLASPPTIFWHFLLFLVPSPTPS